MARSNASSRHFGKKGSRSSRQHDWVARFGTPKTIITDQATQFESQLFKALDNLFGRNRTRTTAYHPATNGIIECWYRSLKAAIHSQESRNWLQALPIVLLGLRTSIKE